MAIQSSHAGKPGTSGKYNRYFIPRIRFFSSASSSVFIFLIYEWVSVRSSVCCLINLSLYFNFVHVCELNFTRDRLSRLL